MENKIAIIGTYLVFCSAHKKTKYFFHVDIFTFALFCQILLFAFKNCNRTSSQKFPSSKITSSIFQTSLSLV